MSRTAKRGFFMKAKQGQSPDLLLFPQSPVDYVTDTQAPLAIRIRPKTLNEIEGQEHLLGPGKLLRRTIESDRLTSLILYGPPGSGKTSLAKVIAHETKTAFISLNAVESGVTELRSVIQNAALLKRQKNQKTVLFIDEIHRFNKAQQDILMPVVEEGTLILIGATTLNPSFVINGPLLSRTSIFELKPLNKQNLKRLIEKALADKSNGLGKFSVMMFDQALEHIIQSSAGDARRALNALEIGVLTTPPNHDNVIIYDQKVAEESCQRKIVYHDKSGDYHYDIASAFIKSMRGSDPDAALYWLAKMIYAGEDPRFIIRRILILASEDIGNADPQALILAAAGLQAIEFVGMPESRIILAQLVTYMSLAPKSNASYKAIEAALEDVKTTKVEEVPNHLRGSSYPGAKKLGHGSGYRYAHNYDGHFVEQEYLSKNSSYYLPANTGFEQDLKVRLEQIKSRQRQTNSEEIELPPK